MNFVIVRHMNDTGKYLFRLPEDVTVDAGTPVLCNTKRGRDVPAVCVTSSFHADPDVIVPLWGTQVSNLQKVTTVLREFKLNWPDEPETEHAETKVDDDGGFPW